MDLFGSTLDDEATLILGRDSNPLSFKPHVMKPHNWCQDLPKLGFTERSLVTERSQREAKG